MKKYKTNDNGYPIFNYKPFNGLINGWNGEKFYLQQKQELNKQIRELISLQLGLGQTSQGNLEDYEYRNYLIEETKKLGISIKNALGIKSNE